MDLASPRKIRPGDLQTPDTGEPLRADGASEEDEGLRVVDIEGVGGVEDVHCFAVDLATGFRES